MNQTLQIFFWGKESLSFFLKKKKQSCKNNISYKKNVFINIIYSSNTKIFEQNYFFNKN